MRTYYEWELTRPGYKTVRVIAANLLTAIEKGAVAWGDSWVDVARDVNTGAATVRKTGEVDNCSGSKRA